MLLKLCMFFLLMSYNGTFITRFLSFHESTWEQNHRAPSIYTNNHYTNVIKSIKMASNSKHRVDQENTGRPKH